MEETGGRKYSSDEYFELDQAAPKGVRLEYFDGTIYLAGRVFEPAAGWDAARSLAGARPEHSQVKNNVEVAVTLQLRDRDCVVFSSDQQVEIATAKGYVYPDVVVTCEPDYKGVILTSPQLLIEVLSKSTARHDLTRKMEAYATIESMKEYWFISTSEVRVIQCCRIGREWIYLHHTDIEQSITSDHFGIEIPMREVYRRVL